MTNPPPSQKVDNPEAAYGGADAVEKTTYVTGRGTDPKDQAKGTTTPPPPGTTGMSPLAWGVIIVAALIALVFILGIFNK
jgi:hypothetical protein